MEKEKIPEAFIKAVNFVIDNADVILDTLSSLARDYMLGRDVRDSLRRFKDSHELPFRLILDIFNKDEKILKWLDEIVEEDKKWIFSKIESYSILHDEFEAVFLEDYDYINPITRILGETDYDEELMIPFLELEFLSYGKKVLNFKEDTDYVLWLISDLTERVLGCLEEYKDKPIREDSIALMRDRLKEIIKNSEEALKTLEEMSGGVEE